MGVRGRGALSGSSITRAAARARVITWLESPAESWEPRQRSKSKWHININFTGVLFPGHCRWLLNAGFLSLDRARRGLIRHNSSSTLISLPERAAQRLLRLSYGWPDVIPPPPTYPWWWGRWWFCSVSVSAWRTPLTSPGQGDWCQGQPSQQGQHSVTPLRETCWTILACN